MATFTIRVYGRFTYATATKNKQPVGEISAIAPRFREPLCAHRTMMSIARQAVALDDTDLPPTFKILSGKEDLLASEMFVWDLAGLNVTFVPRGQPPAILVLDNEDRLIADLAALVDAARLDPAVLDLNALSASSQGKAQTVITVTEGRGHAKEVVATDKAFLIPKRLADANPNPTPEQLSALLSTPINRRVSDGLFVPFKKADVVEFEMAVDVGVPFSFRLTNPETRVENRVSVIAATPTDAIVVDFSNLCSTLPSDELYDQEFGQYYSLLQRDPGDDKLILVPEDTGGENGDCHAQARIDFTKP